MKKFITFCQVLKERYTKENWFLFSASRCTWQVEEPVTIREIVVP